MATSRLNLTYILLDLLDQQEKRKEQLFNTLKAIEIQNEENRQDYWLIQYQKLLDSQPQEMSLNTSNSIDPKLGLNFLLNGVVHCLPFLPKLFKEYELTDITDGHLRLAGVNKTDDRNGILKAINSFLTQQQETINNKIVQIEPSTPHTTTTTNSNINNNNNNDSIVTEEDQRNNDVVNVKTEEIKDNDDNTPRPLTECVICMEMECTMIFLPCGHLCCCYDCQKNLVICPICRGTIDRRIKVIRP